MIILKFFLVTLALSCVSAAPTFFDSDQLHRRFIQFKQRSTDEWNKLCRALQVFQFQCDFNQNPAIPDYPSYFDDDQDEQRPQFRPPTKFITTTTTAKYPSKDFSLVTESNDVPSITTRKSRFIPPYIPPRPDPPVLKPEFNFNTGNSPRTFVPRSFGPRSFGPRTVPTEQDDMNEMAGGEYGLSGEQYDMVDDYNY